MPEDFIHQSRMAYFSMAIALQNEIPTYAGGLRVLAGDTLRSAGEDDRLKQEASAMVEFLKAAN